MENGKLIEVYESLKKDFENKENKWVAIAFDNDFGLGVEVPSMPQKTFLHILFCTGGENLFCSLGNMRYKGEDIKVTDEEVTELVKMLSIDCLDDIADFNGDLYMYDRVEDDNCEVMFLPTRILREDNKNV